MIPATHLVPDVLYVLDPGATQAPRPVWPAHMLYTRCYQPYALVLAQN